LAEHAGGHFKQKPPDVDTLDRCRIASAEPVPSLLLTRSSAAVLKQKSKKGHAMTYEMWGIAIGMALMFGFSLQRYRQSAVHEPQAYRSTKQRLLRKLRERYGL
jgi:hypothetical protein